MNRRIALTAIVISALLFSLVTGVQVVKVAKANFYNPSQTTIGMTYPENKTYQQSSIPLHVGAWTPDNFWMTEGGIVWAGYSIDGQPNATIILVKEKPEQMGGNFYLGTFVTGLVDGSHNITAYVEDNFGRSVSTKTVYFTIDTTYPSVSVISMENKAGIINLNFTVNEETSWMGYSLDGHANVTTLGNISLSGLADGSHNIRIYANDTAGNIGKSDVLFFSVNTHPISSPSPIPSISPSPNMTSSSYPTEQPTLEPSPTAYDFQPEIFTQTLLLYGAIAFVVGAVLLAYFSKHKPNKKPAKSG